MDYFMAGHLKGVRHELLVKSGDVWTVLSRLIADYGIDLVVVGTRGRTGVAKFLLGSVAERIFRQASLSGPHDRPQYFGTGSGGRPSTNPGPDRLCAALAPCGGVRAVAGTELRSSSLALLHVVTDRPGTQDQERIRKERLEQLHAVISADERLPSRPECFMELVQSPKESWRPHPDGIRTSSFSASVTSTKPQEKKRRGQGLRDSVQS